MKQSLFALFLENSDKSEPYMTKQLIYVMTRTVQTGRVRSVFKQKNFLENPENNKKLVFNNKVSSLSQFEIETKWNPSCGNLRPVVRQLAIKRNCHNSFRFRIFDTRKLLEKFPQSVMNLCYVLNKSHFVRFQEKSKKTSNSWKNLKR